VDFETKAIYSGSPRDKCSHFPGHLEAGIMRGFHIIVARVKQPTSWQYQFFHIINDELFLA
jgi:hypothetical protein